ncbi:CDT1-like protein b [Forsythia ovata]|uniref:CDT1-like protein b n=1 Tax=Forsythia ovata TaxID=205694 RepID=A0ABD1X307_9LAMI
MEQTGQENNAQEAREVCLNGAENSSALSSVPSLENGILQKQQPEAKFSSPTPVKTKEPSRIKCKEEAFELPEKYTALSEFFDRLICSLRLLSLRKKSPTFQNISTQVEILAGRKFLLGHLAKIKYVLPEAVQIDKILVHDEETKCMKPDVEIALLFDVIEGHHGESVFMDLSNIFSSRLKKIYITHPEDLDIPEAVLPEPFNQRSINIKVDPTSEDLSALSEMEVLNSSHISPSFRRRFSQKTVAAEKEMTRLLSPIKSACVANQEIEGTRTFPDSSSKSIDTLQVTQTSHCVSSGMSGNTPMKLASPESDNLIVETPAQSTPMRPISPNRSVLTCEDECKTATSQNCTPGNLTAKRSLDFYTFDGDNTSQGFTTDENEMQHSEGVCSTLPQMKMKGILVKDDNVLSVTSLCKVKESSFYTGDDHELNQKKLNSHQQTSICLSDLVLLIHRIFQSVSFRSITKEELVHKIILNNCDIDDSSEVVMQIELLEKLVPDWFYKKFAPCGDLLYNVKKVSDLNSVCEKIDIV